MEIDAEVAADFAALGVAVDRTDCPVAGFAVMPQNWDTVRVFLACETQWRVLARPDGAAVWLGLDYAAVDVVLRRMDLGNDVFGDLQHMERAALEVLGAG